MRTGKSMRQTLGASWVLCVSLLATSVQAAPSDDPPDRVARVSYLKGEVSLKPAGTTDWAPVTLNRPLTTDDQLSVDRDARAELQVGSATIHLNEGTAFSFSELGDSVLQARVTDGAIHLTVRRLQDDEVIEIDTPQAAITVTEPGEYRIEIAADGARTLVKTYSGECEVTGNRDSVRLRAREQIALDETGETVAAYESFAPRDEFDRWAQERNERFSRSASSRYVAPDVIGYEDLDGYGDWASEADYGPIWYPRIAVGWSPYRDGHWAWVSPWGWTWVDNAPWGFAPFHYGRWAHVHGRWGWVPGPMHVRAVYAPALVAWVGGPHLSLSVSFGSHVGWFPLAPREVYVPGYYCSPRHIHNVNYANTIIINKTIINRAYVNRSTPIEYRHRGMRDAVTVVSREAFASARPVSNHMVRNRDTRDWRTHNASPAIAPERASALGPRWNSRESRSPERWNRHANRDVLTRHAPPPPRASFEQEQRAVRENRNRPIPRGDLRSNNRAESGRASGAPGQSSGQRTETWSRDEHPRRSFDRTQFDRRQEESRPSAALSRQERPRFDSAPSDRRRTDSPRERDTLPPSSRTPDARPESAPSERFRPDRETSRRETPRVREFPDTQSGRTPAPQIERRFERQPERQVERQLERQSAPVERHRPAERSERVEAPRRFEPPPQREPRHEPAQRQTPPAASEQRVERHGGRDNRHVRER